MNGKVTYRQQFTRCGKERCRKCHEGPGHGPYWYAYWSEQGRTVSKYIGTRLPEHIVAEQEAHQTRKGEQNNASAGHEGDVAAPQLRIYLLGQFRIERQVHGEWQAVDSKTWHRKRARSLLGCLLSSTARRLGREQVMNLLWPDLDIDVAANRLNGAVHELRQMLEPSLARPAASRMLRLERDVLELADRNIIWVDAEAFEEKIKEADIELDAERKKQLLEEAATLYHGSYLLEELYSEWAIPRRDALQRAWTGLMLNLAQIQVEREEFVSAIEGLDRLRTVDPGNETALQRLMILLTQIDRRGEALQAYRQHVMMLERDYEGEPLPETVELYEKLRQGHIPPVSYPATSRQTTSTKAAPSASEQAKTIETSSSASVTAEKVALREIETISFSRPQLQIGRHNQSPLIGREGELYTLRQVLLHIEGVLQRPASAHGLAVQEDVRTRTRHFLLLKGEPGIGKTRLAEELSIEAYKRDWTVAWSRSYEQESGIPYHPWTELLRTLLLKTSLFSELMQAGSKKEASSQPSLLFKLDRLRALLPELREHDTTQQVATASVSQEQERLYLWEATLTALGILSQHAPLLLILDDLHWADESSIELLTYLIHHLRDQRILLIGTCRDGELAPQHKLRNLIADLQREQAIDIVAVPPLTQSQIGTLVAHLPQEMVRNIQEQASGNPFFAEELARYGGSGFEEDELLESIASEEREKNGQAYMLSTDRSLPEAIAAVLDRRLNRLSSGCQNLLGKAAVLGGSFELRHLLPMANEQNEDSVLDLLDEALSAGLLIEEGTGAHITYHFWHPLIISHLYGRLSAARRAQSHRKAAEALQITAQGQEEKAAAAIVYHLIKGGGSASAIARYAEISGNQAYALASYSEAQQYYIQVLQAMARNELYDAEICTQVHDQIQALRRKIKSTQELFANPLHACRIIERVAECSTILGNFEEGQQLYRAILALRTSEPFQRAITRLIPEEKEREQQEAQIQALLWREIGKGWVSTGEYEQAYTCYNRGKEVMEKAGVTSGAAWAGLHLEYGAMLRIEGRYHEARKYLQDALDMLNSTVPGAQETANQWRKDQAARIQMGERLNRQARAGAYEDHLPTRTERALFGTLVDVGYAHERLGIVAASLGEADSAEAHLKTALAIYEQSECVAEMARVYGNLGAFYIFKSEHVQARTYMHHSLELAERGGDLPNMAFTMANLADVAYRSGELLDAESWYKQSIALAERIHDRERISGCNTELAYVQQDLGKLSEAAASIRRAASIGREIKSTRCSCYAMVALADLRITQALRRDLLLQEDPNRHEHVRHSLLRARNTLQGVIELAGMEVENIVYGKYLLSLVYVLLGNLDGALRIAEETLCEAQGHKLTRIVGRSYRLLGKIFLLRGEREQGYRYFQQAIVVCQKHGLQLEYARALYSYGSAQVMLERETEQQGEEYRQGVHSLHEARRIFRACRAMLDLEMTEYALAQLEKEEIVHS
jgi:DNA-binding SARP family transcriptional activator/tetratricopeptide (TPR) repeat protein